MDLALILLTIGTTGFICCRNTFFRPHILIYACSIIICGVVFIFFGVCGWMIIYDEIYYLLTIVIENENRLFSLIEQIYHSCVNYLIALIEKFKGVRLPMELPLDCGGDEYEINADLIQEKSTEVEIKSEPNYMVTGGENNSDTNNDNGMVKVEGNSSPAFDFKEGGNVDNRDINKINNTVDNNPSNVPKEKITDPNANTKDTSNRDYPSGGTDNNSGKEEQNRLQDKIDKTREQSNDLDYDMNKKEAENKAINKRIKRVDIEKWRATVKKETNTTNTDEYNTEMERLNKEEKNLLKTKNINKLKIKECSDEIEKVNKEGENLAKALDESKARFALKKARMSNESYNEDESRPLKISRKSGPFSCPPKKE